MDNLATKLLTPATIDPALTQPASSEVPVVATATAGPKPGAMDDTLYTTEELAAWLMISPSTIEKDRSLGRGSYPVFVKVGGRRVMYRHADIIDWLHDNRYNPDLSRA